MKNTIIACVIGAGFFLTGAMAQQPAQQCGDMANMECCKSMQGMGDMKGMMPGMNPAMMPQMMAGHNDAAKLVDQLVASMASIEAEKNGKARAEKLAAHAALLKELQAKLQAQMPKADEDHKH